VYCAASCGHSAVANSLRGVNCNVVWNACSVSALVCHKRLECAAWNWLVADEAPNCLRLVEREFVSKTGMLTTRCLVQPFKLKPVNTPY